MITIKGDKNLYVDCDNTLCVWDSSTFDSPPPLEVKCFGQTSYLHPHQKNINLVEKFFKLGYSIYVWSGSGAEWAEALVKALNIEDMVTLCIAKPRYHMDDMPCASWMGENIWRAPNG